jgi:hypothetical protein
MKNRISSEVAFEVATVLDRLIAKIRASERS